MIFSATENITSDSDISDLGFEIAGFVQFRNPGSFAGVFIVRFIKGRTHIQPARQGVTKYVMQRFKQNDGVFILPKFAHLYPGHSATVVSISPDPFRPMFNVYTLEFADRSTARLFEFQMIEDEKRYRTFIASLIFDSRQQRRAVQRACR